MSVDEIGISDSGQPTEAVGKAPKKKRTMRQRGVRALQILLLGLVLAELLLRLIGGIPTLLARIGGGRANMKLLIELLDADNECGFALKESAEADALVHEETIRVTVDDKGFRLMPQGDPSAPTIMILGDSNSFGWGVSNEQTYSYYLGQNIEKEIGVLPRVINGGVPGYSILRSECRFMKMIQGVKPSLIILQVSANNNSNMSNTSEMDMIANPEIFIDIQRAFHRPLVVWQLVSLINAVRKHSWAWTGNREKDFNVSYAEMNDVLNRIALTAASIGSKLIIISIYAPQLMLHRDSNSKYQLELENILKDLEKKKLARVLLSRQLFTMRDWKSGIDNRHPDASGHALIAQKLHQQVMEILAPATAPAVAPVER
jgi:lysophospholipase L1-like esterase